MPLLTISRRLNPVMTRMLMVALLMILALAGVARADRLLPDTVNQVNSGNRAVNSLIETARQYLRNGAPEAAASELERAIRIAPRSGLTWHELARVRFVQGRHGDAESLSTKAAILIGRDESDLKYANDRLQQLSQRAQGKESGQSLAGSAVPATTARRTLEPAVKNGGQQQVVHVRAQPQPKYKIQTFRSAQPKAKKTPPATPTQTPAPTATQAPTSEPVAARVQQTQPTQTAMSAPTIAPAQSSTPRLNASKSQQTTTARVTQATRATEKETTLSPARPLGVQANESPVRKSNSVSNERLARRAPPPVSSSRSYDPSQPARVVERSAPLVTSNRLIKRRPEKTRMTILLFQAKRGAPVVEKSLIYQHRKPSPVAIN